MADYKVTDTELTSIANAIRTKGGTSSQLEFPTGFVSAVQAIPTGGGVIQSLSVTQNGTYNPPSGVDGYAPVVVNVSGGGGEIANWDFTNSLVDSINGYEVTLVNANRDSEGVHINSAAGYIVLPVGLIGGLRTIEIDFGDITFVNNNDSQRIIYTNSNSSFTYKWSNPVGFRMYINGWQTASNITDVEYLKNSTLKITIDENNHWRFYRNDVLFLEELSAASIIEVFRIGSERLSIQNAVIKAIRVRQ